MKNYKLVLLIFSLNWLFMLSCSKDETTEEPIEEPVEEPTRAPIAEFTVDTVLHEANEDFQFFDQSEFLPSLWLWTFSDGSTSTQQNPKKRFEEEGTYTVSLTVSNTLGSDTKTKIDYVTVGRYNTFTDSDGQVYDIVKIGNQTWFAENLRAAYKNSYNKDDYGILYEWWQGQLAIPAGWRMPTNADWQELIDYLGGENVAGGKMKASGTEFWKSPNLGATNESSFNALGGGYFGYQPSGYFNETKEVRYWINGGQEPNVPYLALYFDESNVSFGTMHTYGGCYVRPIKVE